MNERQLGQFSILEDLQGEVISLDSETFYARMLPTTREDSDEAIITFQLTDVPSDMRDRIRFGGTLRWIYGEYDGNLIDVFDVDPIPGKSLLKQRTSLSLGELASRSKVVRPSEEDTLPRADVVAQDDGREIIDTGSYMEISDGSPGSGNPVGKVVIRDKDGKIIGVQG